jgi:hypothetical protein
MRQSRRFRRGVSGVPVRQDGTAAPPKAAAKHQPLRSSVSWLPTIIVGETVAGRATSQGRTMSSSTVDVVLAGNEGAVLDAAVQAVRHGQRVLIVLRSGNARVVSSRLRCMCRADNAEDAQVTVMTNAEVVCVDGVAGVEAVVIRDARTGRLHGVNTSAFVSCNDWVSGRERRRT